MLVSFFSMTQNPQGRSVGMMNTSITKTINRVSRQASNILISSFRYFNRREVKPRKKKKKNGAYVTLCAGQLQFIDCFKFLNFPQGMLASKLKNEDLKLTGKDCTKNELKLLCRKGVYTYKYVNYHKRFNKTELPPKKSFYSPLTRDNITD